MSKGMGQSAFDHDLQSVRVGLIHSLSGTMAISEAPLLEAELLAIDEINKTGGILGCQIEPVTMDGASAPETFALKAQELLSSGVKFLFGCWTSASRKAVKPIVEDADGLLWYPVQYEGLEESEHIVYTGSCPVQQIVPAVGWVLAHIGSRIFLVGSDYVFPRTANNLIRSQVGNRRGSIVGERYVPQGGMDFASIIEEIQRQKPDAVFSTVFGESNLAFYRQYHAAGIDAQSIPIMAVCISEAELQSIANVAAGHYACLNYFQSLNRPENRRFVANYKKRCGEARVCSASMANAYAQIYLWKRAAEAAGSLDVAQVRSHVVGCEFLGPAGPIVIESNHHTSMCAYIGRATPHGQFEVLGSTAAIRPWPWLGIEDSKLLYKTAVKEAMAAYPEVENALVELAVADKGFRETSQLNSLLLDSIPNPTVLVGADHIVLGANRVALEIGVKIGEPCWQGFCKGKYRDACLAERAIDEDETKHCETEMYGRVWDTFWVPVGKDAYLHYLVDITERKRMESTLRERVNELNCLHGVTRSIERFDGNLDAMMSEVVSIIPPAYAYPDIACARIALGNQMFESAKFNESKWKQSADIKALGSIAGTLEVYYLEEKPGSFEGPFAKEERDLIDAIAERLGRVVERKRVQDALRESEEKFRRIAENTIDNIFELDLDGTIRYDSPASERILGYKPEELTGRSAEFLFSDSELPKLYDSLAVIANGKNVERLETEMLTKDGSQVSVEINASPILREERIVGALGILRDITERKQAEEALRRSEGRFRQAMEATSDGLWDWNVETGEMYFSPAYYQMLGYEPGELSGLKKTWMELIHPDDRDQALRSNQDCVENRIPSFGIEFRMRTKSSGWRWILGRGRASVRDANGRALRMIGTHVDITERKEGEEKMRESEHRYRVLFDSTNDAIFIHDMGGKFLEANQVACERLGYSREELLQMTPTDINSPEYAATVPQRIEELRKLGHSLSEIAQVRRDGTIIQTELSSRIVDYKGKPAVLSIARDITERKQVERLKDQFVSTVSHELRTPLTAIRASIGLLASGASGTLPEKGQRMLEIAVTNTDRLVRLINDILDSERLASGKTPMEKKQCSAAQLVTQAADVMKPMAEKAGISLSAESQDAALWADPDRIAQALTNLTSNAIKFSPKGGRIWITAERKENQMLFKVRDEGRGIPSDKLGLLFERFQQVDASDAREKGGTGLGLSISKSIVEQHSGRIWAESTIGKGSTFFFTLPLPQETEVPAQPVAMTEVQGARRVLIIEDDPDLANILAIMLQRHDIQPYLALTGEKGITLSKQIHPDMIVLDLGLPDMDGSAVVQALREDNTLRLVPLVVYTVRELDKQQRENLRLGETLFFTKSRIPPDQFEEKVVQFMKRILENRGKTNVS